MLRTLTILILASIAAPCYADGSSEKTPYRILAVTDFSVEAYRSQNVMANVYPSFYSNGVGGASAIGLDLFKYGKDSLYATYDVSLDRGVETNYFKLSSNLELGLKFDLRSVFYRNTVSFFYEKWETAAYMNDLYGTIFNVGEKVGLKYEWHER